MSAFNETSQITDRKRELLTPALADALTFQERELLSSIQQIEDPVERWHAIATTVLTPEHSWELHQHLYDANYVGSVVAPIWSPSEGDKLHSNVGKLMQERGFTKYEEFYQWSINQPEEFWHTCIQKVGVSLDSPYRVVFDTESSPHGVKSVDYLAGASLNIASSCFNKRAPTETAIVYASEGDATLIHVTFDELNKMTNRIANALLRPSHEGGLGLSYGDAVGICMPMTIEAVAAYLGIVKAGCAVVSIADSFSAHEIETRMKLSNAKAIFTQDVVYRKDKYLELYARILKAQHLECQYVAKVVVIPGLGETVHPSVASLLRPGLDFDYHTFLGADSVENNVFEAVSCPSSHVCNILFSSGTTGEPKAIPWTHATPIKCAIDGYLHQDIQVGDVVAWPTNLGWMMGPWLLFQLINGCTLALFGGVTSTAAFCQFVEVAQVSMLGVVPSLVKAWQAGNCTQGSNWSCVRKFSSSGEASDPRAMLWLSSRAHYKPIIEYCGGTEVAGSYLSSTMVQPNAPSLFSTPVLGSNFLIMNDEGAETLQGEIALIPPALGLSTRLLNRDHHDCYYLDMPLGPKGQILRRHGDEIQTVLWTPLSSSTPLKYYRALGRCDDTMNIGGIKVSSVEIERVCNLVDGVSETAAIGVSPAAGGPSQLILFVILKTNNSNNNDHHQHHSQNQEDDSKAILKTMRVQCQNAIKTELNPLFHIGDLVIQEKLPRTASNKIMRRILRDEYILLRDAPKPLTS